MVKKTKGSKGFSKNQYTVKMKGHSTPQNRGTTKSHLPARASLTVESEAILRVVRYEAGTEEDPAQYG